MSELKPCPFCGSDKLNVGLIRATPSLSYWSVECANCGVEIGDDESEDAVVTHWNTRAAPLPAGDDGELCARLTGNDYTCPENMGCGTMKFCACDTMEDAAARIAALNEQLAVAAQQNEAFVQAYEARAGEIAALNAEVARLRLWLDTAMQVGRAQLAAEWAEWLEQPCQAVQDKNRQPIFDEAAMLTSAAAGKAASAEFAKLPVEMQFDQAVIEQVYSNTAALGDRHE